MLLSAVDRALEEFLQADEPRILALTGEWGRGKSYYWRSFLSSRPPGAHRVHSYAYVSLFGLKDLGDLQDALVAGTVPISTLSAVPRSSVLSQRSLIGRCKDRLNRMGVGFLRKSRSYSDLLDNLPKVGELGPFARAVAFRFVADGLVCIDDVERRGDLLSLRDVLGVASMLREQRACRVLVILNSDALSPEDLKLFHTLREKVFDAEIAFDPSPEECAAIAFPKGSRLYERATGYAVRLAITNIRVLYRIRRLIDAVADYAMAADDEIQTQIIQSSVLLGWCFNSRDGRAPAFDYVKRLNVASFVDFGEPKKRSEAEIAWNQLLSDYGYTNSDDLDAALCNVLERGYVETESLTTVLSNRAEAVRRARLERGFEEAWDLYHGSFDPDPKPLVSAFAAAVKAGAEVISSMNASSTTLLLRSLGYDGLADELMLHWIDVNGRVRPTALNIEASDWKEEVRDPRFRAEAQSAFARLAPTRRSFRETALALAEQNGWNEEDIQVLTAASVDEYYELFKSLAQGQTGRVVRSLLRFEEFSSPQPTYHKIAYHAREALVRIGRESALNRRRVKSYGIDLDVVDQTSDVGCDSGGTNDEQPHAAG